MMMFYVIHSLLICWIFSVVQEIQSISSETSESKDHTVVTTDDENNLLIRVRVKPRAVANTIIGVEINEVTICIVAPDVGEKANKELIKYLAEVLKVRYEQLSIIEGHNIDLKIVKLKGTDLLAGHIVYELASTLVKPD